MIINSFYNVIPFLLNKEILTQILFNLIKYIYVGIRL